MKRTPEEEKAKKVTDAQIKRFWKERENERISKRVHQGGLTVEEKVLRFWDMSSQYGVCVPSFTSFFFYSISFEILLLLLLSCYL